MTTNEFLYVLKQYARNNDCDFRYIPYDLIDKAYTGEFTDEFSIEKNGIDVDFENVAFSGEYDVPGSENLKLIEMIGDTPVAWCACGGDWEMPLVFCIYMNSDGKFKGYIPKEGNAYNKLQMCAFGSERHGEELDEDEVEKLHKVDVNELRKDVEQFFKERK